MSYSFPPNEQGIVSPYNIALKSPKWAKRKLQILDLYNHKCKYCQSTENLQVHHTHYRIYKETKEWAEPHEYPDSALICVCKKCHTEIHETTPMYWHYVSIKNKKCYD